MAMLTFAYTGLALTFWSGVYGTCIGRSDFSDAKSLVGLHGIGKYKMSYPPSKVSGKPGRYIDLT